MGISGVTSLGRIAWRLVLALLVPMIYLVVVLLSPPNSEVQTYDVGPVVMPDPIQTEPLIAAPVTRAVIEPAVRHFKSKASRFADKKSKQEHRSDGVQSLPPEVSAQSDLIQLPQTECPRADEVAEWTKSNNLSDACIAAYIDKLCAPKDSELEVKLARYIGTHPIDVLKGLGRYNVLNDQTVGSWCDIPPQGRNQAIAIARTPKKGINQAKAEANREYLVYTMSDGDGVINAGGYSAAVEQRRRLLQGDDTGRKAASSATQVSAVLSASQSAMTWNNLSGYTHPVGRINDLLIDAGGTVSSRSMWAGTDGGGIWHSGDGGGSWTPVNDFNGSLAIGKVLRSPRNLQEMYASTNPYGSHTYSPFGVLKSTDGGVTWTQLPQTNPAVYPDWDFVTHLAIHPAGVAGMDVLLAATINGVYQSTDSGATWGKVSASKFASFVAFHPMDGDRRAYALNDGTITITTNGSWPSATTYTVLAGTTSAYTKFAFSPNDVGVMYALATGGNSSTNLLRSADAGATWTVLTSPPSYTFYNNGYLWFTGALWVDPTNSSRIGVAERWAATTPNVQTATETAGWNLSLIGWTDFHGIVSDPEYNGTTNKVLYMMDDGGLYRFYGEVNSPSGWEYLATGMTITEAYSVSGHGGNVIFGAQDVSPRVYRSAPPSDLTQKWRLIGNPPSSSWIGDGATTAVSASNGDVLYGSRQYLDLFRSIDGGVTGESICGVAPTNITEGRCGGNYAAGFIAPFVLDPNSSNTMLAGAASLWRSTNVESGVPSWSTIHSGTGSRVAAIAIAATDSNVIWIAYSDGRVFRTNNGLALAPTWSQITSVPSGIKLRIFVDRTNANTVYLGLAGFTGNKLYVTRNGGSSWDPVPGLPAASVMALEQHPANSAWLYVGTAVGLFSSRDGGATWSASNEGPANVQIRDLTWYSAGAYGADLLVATFGRGIWRTTIWTSTHDLTVNSSGATSVAISSETGHGGTTNYALSGLGSGTSVSLTAPATVGSAAFVRWDGCDSGSGMTCVVAMTANKTVTAVYFTPTYSLNVNSSGATSVAISSETGHGGTTNYALSGLASGTSVSLTAPATVGSGAFVRWDGCDSGSGVTCVVAMTGNKTVTVVYLTPMYSLNVNSSGAALVAIASGTGHGGTTNYTLSGLASGTSVSLTAPSTAGSKAFVRWDGCDSGSGLTCIVAMTGNRTVTVSFATRVVHLTVSSRGLGVISSVPPGINCGTDCAEDYADGTTITLAATPDAKARFVGWGGACSGKGTCTIILSGDTSVTSAFARNVNIASLLSSILDSPPVPIYASNPAAGISASGSAIWLRLDSISGSKANFTIGKLSGSFLTSGVFRVMNNGAYTGLDVSYSAGANTASFSYELGTVAANHVIKAQRYDAAGIPGGYDSNVVSGTVTINVTLR